MGKDMVSLTIEGEVRQYPAGTSFLAISQEYQEKYPDDIVLVVYNNRLRELNKTAQRDGMLSFVTTADKTGKKTYRRSVTLLMQKAVYNLWGSEHISVRVLYSIGQGYYCELREKADGQERVIAVDEERAIALKKEMYRLVTEDIEIEKRSMNTDDAIALFHDLGMEDKEKLFKYRRSSRVNIYVLDHYKDYFYGFMVPSTGYLRYYDIVTYEDGFVLLFPNENTREVAEFAPSGKLFHTLKASREWGRMLEIGTIGALAIGIAFVMPNFQMPAFTDFIHGGGPIVGGPVIPFIFITIACGALSGFHATIGTGTTPKMVGNERDVLFVGYGAMLMEGFVAIMALVAACVLVPADYFAINAPAEKFQALGMAVQELPRLEAEVQESLMARPGGSVSLAVGMAHIFSKIPFMEHLMAYWYHFAIMFEAVFILTAVDAGTRVGRFFLQEMIGKVIPKFADKEWVPGVIITSVLFTGSWGYLVYSGDIGSIWPLFGICNQLLASVTLLIGTTVILRMNKAKYAWITGVPGLFMTVITFWAGIWLIVNQYLPGGKILLATLSVIVMLLMLFVIYGTLRRWFALLAIHTTTKDEYGEDVKVVVQE